MGQLRRTPFGPAHVVRPHRRTRAAALREQVVRLLDRSRLAVIHGGDKSVEGAVIAPGGHQRSWKSYEPVARDIADALTRLGCRAVSVTSDDMRLGAFLSAQRTHLAWLNTAGVQGSSSIAHAPSMLELFGIPYVGHDPMTAAMLDNKHVFKRQLRAVGIATPDFHLWRAAASPARIGSDPMFLAVFGAYRGPFVVKPVCGRASLHVAHVTIVSDLDDAIHAVHSATGHHVLVERFMPGPEYCIAVAGSVVSRGRRLERFAAPFVFSALERILAPGEHIFTSMDARPISLSRARCLDPAAEAELSARLSGLACRVFTELGLETLVRLDVRADAHGELFVLEANPKPDLKAPDGAGTSLVCMGLGHEGMDYDDLILSLFADRIDGLLRGMRGADDRLTSLL